MLGPYRDPVTVPVDVDLLPEPLPDRCITTPQGCSHRPPPAVASLPAPLLPPAFARALAASATLLLFAASTSIFTSTWITASGFANARHAKAEASAPRAFPGTEQLAKRPASYPQPPAANHPMPFTGGPRPFDTDRGGSALARLGPLSHHVDTLWKRAEKAGTFTLARATVVRGAVAPGDPTTWIGEPNGLRVTNVDPPWPVSLIGLRRGDLITGINGFTMGRPEDAAFARVALGGNALVELLRDGKPVALRIDWAP
jgi:hypothetical protein